MVPWAPLKILWHMLNGPRQARAIAANGGEISGDFARGKHNVARF
jgi:hypothetical protein